MIATIAVAVSTYKRPHLLGLLVRDILNQTLVPDRIIVVDGDPSSGDVRAELAAIQTQIPIAYVPSNHANLAYQRYLGWREAARSGADCIIYFDDDERVLQKDVLNYLVRPLRESDDVVGVGCVIQFGHLSDGSDASRARALSTSTFLRRFGSSWQLQPGGLTPIGNRMPLEDSGSDYLESQWLRGGVMSFSMAAVEQGTFSEDLFALYHIRRGLGEDTFLSRRVGAKGKLLYTFRAIVEHPNADTPKAYPYEAYKYAYAAAYSRRFLNDYYRVYDPPRLSDRWALVKSYAGNTLLAWWRAMTKPSWLNFSLARGTTLGAIHGLLRPPTAKRLTPEIDWWADAEDALKQLEVINHASN